MLFLIYLQIVNNGMKAQKTGLAGNKMLDNFLSCMRLNGQPKESSYNPADA